jgi:hypothetical protein
LFASGRQEEPVVATRNDRWVLCVTSFDLSSIPEDKLSVANLIKRKIVERLNDISFRTRVSIEYTYYEEFAWSRDRAAAARALSAKQDERSMLIFRGDPGWRYRRNLERLDADIERLRTALEEAENNLPLINNEPIFGLTAGNRDFSFPAPPTAGNEIRFCQQQNVDAFLTGSIMDFHGRFFVSIRLFTLFTESYIWEDSIIFSTVDIDDAIAELTRRLNIVLSGNRPAGIIVNATPEDTLVLVNRSFAGRGETGLLEFPPGKFLITASAPDHETLSIEKEILPGEVVEIGFSLKPIEFGNVLISGLTSGGSVYSGALYVGEAPLTLRLPLNTLEYVELITYNEHRGTMAFVTPNNSEFEYLLQVPTESPLASGRVERARRMYYWGWGGVWVTGIVAWITYNNYIAADFAIRHEYNRTGVFNEEFAQANIRMYYISMGTAIAAGAVAVYQTVQLIRYISISSKGSTPVARTGRNR